MSSPPTLRRSTRAVLALGVCVGLVTAVVMPTATPDQVGLAAEVFHHAATAALAGEEFYAVAPPDHPGYTFIYPPIVVLAFVPHALLGSPRAAYALQVLLGLVAALATAGLIVRAVERRGVAVPRADRLLLGAFAVGSIWGVGQLVMGQTTLWLAAGIALGIDRLERQPSASARSREWLAGVAIGLVALVKVFPAVIGAWLLRRRADAAVAAAIATGLGGLLAGVAVFGPDVTVHYLTEILVGRHEGATFEGTPAPARNHATVRRQLAALLGGGSSLITPLALGLVAPLVALTYRDVSTHRRRLAALLATLAGTLLVLPLQPLYFTLLYYPLLVLVILQPAGWARRCLLGGTLASFLLVEFELVPTVAASLPTVVGDPLVAATRALYTVILPPTVGTWLLLVGCVLVHREADADDRSSDERARSASVAGAEHDPLERG